MSGQLDQISEAIGQLRADVRTLHGCVDDLRGEVKDLRDDLTIDKSDLAKLKAKGAGVLLGVSAVSGLAGAKLPALLAAIQRIFGQ